MYFIILYICFTISVNCLLVHKQIQQQQKQHMYQVATPVDDPHFQPINIEVSQGIGNAVKSNNFDESTNANATAIQSKQNHQIYKEPKEIDDPAWLNKFKPNSAGTSTTANDTAMIQTNTCDNIQGQSFNYGYTQGKYWTGSSCHSSGDIFSAGGWKTCAAQCLRQMCQYWHMWIRCDGTFQCSFRYGNCVLSDHYVYMAGVEHCLGC